MSQQYKVLTSLSGRGVLWSPGQILTEGVEVERDEARRHVDAGHIELHVSVAPETTMRSPAETAMRRPSRARKG